MSVDEKALFKRIDRVCTALEQRNEIAQKMFEAMPKPENKAMKLLKVIVLIVGALGILHTSDVIRRWIIGG